MPLLFHIPTLCLSLLCTTDFVQVLLEYEETLLYSREGLSTTKQRLIYSVGSLIMATRLARVLESAAGTGL